MYSPLSSIGPLTAIAARTEPGLIIFHVRNITPYGSQSNALFGGQKLALLIGALELGHVRRAHLSRAVSSEEGLHLL